MKSELKQWVANGDDCLVKAKWERSAGKVYLMMFWDVVGGIRPKRVSQWWRRLTLTLFCAFRGQSRRNVLVNSRKVWSCCLTMPDPLDSANNETIVIIQTLLSDNRRLSVTNIFKEIAAHYSYMNVNQISVYHILRNELDATKVSTQWVPQLLTDEHPTARMDAAL